MVNIVATTVLWWYTRRRLPIFAWNNWAALQGLHRPGPFSETVISFHRLQNCCQLQHKFLGFGSIGYTIEPCEVPKTLIEHTWSCQLDTSVNRIFHNYHFHFVWVIGMLHCYPKDPTASWSSTEYLTVERAVANKQPAVHDC